jgi:hypothetical protein
VGGSSSIRNVEMSHWEPGELRVIICLLLLSCLSGSAVAQDEPTTRNEAWPEVDVFINLNPKWGLLFLGNISQERETNIDFEGQVGAHVDYFLNKHLVFRTGYRYGFSVGRRGAVVKGDEGYAAVGRRGAVVSGEEGAAAVGRRGAVVAGEEGYAAVGRRGGVVVGNRYEDYEAWRAVAGVGAAIAIGTMLARPPSAATTVVIGGTTYWRYQNTYYMRVYSGGNVAYQVVAPPR